MRNHVAILCTLAVLFAGAARGAEVSEAWTRLYNGPNNHSDEGNQIAVTPAGDVYVAATSYNPTTFRYDLTVLKYAPDGTLLWDETREVRLMSTGITGLTTDSAGHALVASATFASSGGGARELSVWKFDATTGALLWDQHLADAGGCLLGDIKVAVLGVDAEDNVLAAGCGMTLYKFSPDGAVLWQRSGVPAKLAFATDIAIEPNGRIHLAGNDNDFSTIGVVVYDADGNAQWDRVTHGPIFNTFGRTRVDVNPAGETVIAGDVESTCGLFALRLEHYDAAGGLRWQRDFPDAPCTSFTLTDMAIAPTGDILVAGSLGGSADVALLKYRPDGTREWVRTYNGPAGSSDIAFGLTLDAHGNAYVVGEELFAAPQNRDIVTLKYDLAGNRDWAISFAGPAGGNDRPQGIAVSRCGRVYVTGYGWNPATNEDTYILAYAQQFAGDLDADGDVDLADFAEFQQHFGEQSAPPVPGDLDGDHDVDLTDLALLLGETTTPCD